MRNVALKLPELAFVVVTRAALAFGAGLLASEKMSDARRRQVGKTLVAIGVLSTLPAVMTIRRRMSA
jgi:hypothetical protein